MYKKPSVLLLVLDIFKTTGGVQKVGRTLSRVLLDNQILSISTHKILSMYDDNSKRERRYTTEKYFRGFNGKKLIFFIVAVKEALRHEVLLLSHISLVSVALCVKVLNPAKRIILIAHGIEVWKPTSIFLKYFLKRYVEIVCVSRYTKARMIEAHHLRPAQIQVLNNCLDPFFNTPKSFVKPQYLLDRFNLNNRQPILVTITRLTEHEKLKGYDTILNLLPDLIPDFPDLNYILAGQASVSEKIRITNLVTQLGIQKHVTLCDFIEEKELTNFYKLGDLFILSSSKEGFGLVLIEAAACGCKIIAGNQDGSIDALMDGELGMLIDPRRPDELRIAIKMSLKLSSNVAQKQLIQRKCLENFNYQSYSKKLNKILFNNA
jgi:phosphatidylinositol alpha-1,6-mannosyltransferase